MRESETERPHGRVRARRAVWPRAAWSLAVVVLIAGDAGADDDDDAVVTSTSVEETAPSQPTILPNGETQAEFEKRMRQEQTLEEQSYVERIIEEMREELGSLAKTWGGPAIIHGARYAATPQGGMDPFNSTQTMSAFMPNQATYNVRLGPIDFFFRGAQVVNNLVFNTSIGFRASFMSATSGWR